MTLRTNLHLWLWKTLNDATEEWTCVSSEEKKPINKIFPFLKTGTWKENVNTFWPFFRLPALFSKDGDAQKSKALSPTPKFCVLFRWVNADRLKNFHNALDLLKTFFRLLSLHSPTPRFAPNPESLFVSNEASTIIKRAELSYTTRRNPELSTTHCICGTTRRRQSRGKFFPNNFLTR